LSELNQLTPQKRFDNKYICHISKLGSILDLMSKDYKILEINGKRHSHYSNLYFDTKDLTFYHNHINGKLGRQKVRLRHYDTSNENYIEIKYKNNKKETSKTRIKINEFNSQVISNFRDILDKGLSVNTDELIATLTLTYNRITLIRPDSFDKFTFDYGLSANTSGNKSLYFNGLLIIEHKSTNKTDANKLPEKLNHIELKKMSISKYCLGLVLSKDNIKYNTYKSKLITIQKVSNGINTKYPLYSWSN
jgi:hypothetical protein